MLPSATLATIFFFAPPTAGSMVADRLLATQVVRLAAPEGSVQFTAFYDVRLGEVRVDGPTPLRLAASLGGGVLAGGPARTTAKGDVALAVPIRVDLLLAPLAVELELRPAIAVDGAVSFGGYLATRASF